MTAKAATVALLAISTLTVVACSLVTTISPHDMTLTAIGETHVRMHIYLKEHRQCPKTLSQLPQRDEYINRTTDGWDRPLIYSVDDGGIITLLSLGRDGVAGGTGDDQDITRRFRTRNDDGTLNVDGELWTVTSEIHD